MSLIFVGEIIPGITLDMRVGDPESHTVRTHYSGVKGGSEVRLGHGGRVIEFDFILASPTFRTAVIVQQLLAKFDSRVQEHGTLHVLDHEGTTVRRFLNCTFEGCTPLDQPIRDDARTMILGLIPTYHAGVRLTFYQVTITEDYTGK
jgi:hypothetical protein